MKTRETLSNRSTMIKIVIADDHDLVRAGIRNALQDFDHLDIVREVGSGSELLHVLGEHAVDFLLLDVNMPDFDPLGEIYNIRSLYPDLKILVVSAFDDDVYVQGLLSAGAHGYHLKDQPLSDLYLAIERILSGERWVSSPLVAKLLSSTQQPALPRLSKRQVEIAQCLVEGFGNREIAEQLFLSVKTVENHLTRFYNQLHVKNRLEALTYIHQHPELLALPGQVFHQEASPTRMLFSGQTSILVLDDNKRYRKQLSRMVGKVHPNAMIYEAGCLQEALHILASTTPRIIFVDVVLGSEDGISCTRRISKQVPGARIIMISAYPDREFHIQGLEAGASAFIDKKDLDSLTLQQIIEDAVH
jgi:DNA-binding NarL/FixJ family response regulator